MFTYVEEDIAKPEFLCCIFELTLIFNFFINILVFFGLELLISFDQSTYAVGEDERYVNITIMLTGRASREVLITLSTRDGSAVCEYYV